MTLKNGKTKEERLGFQKSGDWIRVFFVYYLDVWIMGYINILVPQDFRGILWNALAQMSQEGIF